MLIFKFNLLLLTLLLCCVVVSCQTLLQNVDSKVDIIRPYCFRFTWLGPKFNEESEFKNATCSDIVKGSSNVPCTHPLVVTNNSNIPDTDYMWEEYSNKPTQIACRLVRGEVCAKFSYTFNGAIENITYLCTKVNIENETAVESGCFKQMKNGHEIEVCVCESMAGFVPCNSVDKLSSLLIWLFIAILIAGFIIS